MPVSKVKTKSVFDSFTYLPIIPASKNVDTDLTQLYSFVKPFLDRIDWEILSNSIEGVAGFSLTAIVFYLRRRLDVMATRFNDMSYHHLQNESTLPTLLAKENAVERGDGDGIVEEDDDFV